MKVIIKTSLILMLLCVSLSQTVLADSRPIYIGDIIELDIDSTSVDEEFLREVFYEFEIVELQEMASGFRVKLRSFKPGMYEVEINNQKIQIIVHSLLEDTEEPKLKEEDWELEKPGHWKVAMYITLVVIVGLIATIVIRLGIRKKSRSSQPLDKLTELEIAFNEAIQDDIDFSKYVLKACRKYLSVAIEETIQYETTEKIVELLVEKYGIIGDQIGQWMLKLDTLHYSGEMISTEDRQRIIDDGIRFFQEVDEQIQEAIE